MKRFFTITALAALTICTAISCSSVLETTDYDWAGVNARNEPENDGSISLPVITGPASTSNRPRIDIWFPSQADILREPAASSTTALRAFMTIYTFTDPAEANWQSKGLTSVLSSTALPYAFVSKSGQTITVEIDDEFSGTYSDLIVKFDGQTYTHSRGIKMDVDANGIGGEAVYDDLYNLVPLSGSTGISWVSPGNKGWNVSLISSTPASWTSAAATTSEVITSLPAANINLSGIIPGNDDGKAVYKAVADMIAGSIKLEEFNGTAWIAVSTAEYNPDSPAVLRFPGVTFKHNTLYRVKWTGNANLQTSGTYFNVKQRFYVTGGLPNSSDNRERYSRTQIVGSTMSVFNGDMIEETGSNPSVTVLQGAQGRNVVLRLEFPIINSVGLDEMPAADFINGGGFRIVYRTGGTISNFMTANDLISVKITGARYASEDALPAGLTNVIYITLDPNFQYTGQDLYFLINDKLKYTGNSPSIIFGQKSNYTYNGFRQYGPF